MNTSDFLPHGTCLLWKWPLILTIIAGDASVACAYFLIPFLLRKAALKGVINLSRDARRALVDFAMFILFCGGGHVIYIILLWHPRYWLGALWTLGTAFYSWRCYLRIRKHTGAYIKLLNEPIDYDNLKKANIHLLERVQSMEAGLRGNG